MTAQETNGKNFFETTVTTQVGASDLTASVATYAGLSTPFYVVFDPDVPARREIWLVDDASTTSTSMVVSDISKRYLTGSAAGSGITHPVGSVVRFGPVWQHLEDVNDRIDAVSTVASAALPKAGGTVSGEVNHADQLVTRALLKDYGEEVVAHGNTGTTETIDIESGNVHTITLDNSCTLTFSNPTASGDSCSFTLIVTQDATGSRAITWPASVKWPGGAAPTLTTTASKRDKLVFETIDGGTTWDGNLVGKNYS